jgi:regulator of protease activity HflC (stomatin/prohibitin superfamily)
MQPNLSTYLNNKKLIRTVVFALVALTFLIWSVDIVQTGRTQVVTRFGKVVRTNGDGIALHIPIIEQTKSIDTTIRRESADAVAATSNLQQVTASVAVNYRITRENAVKQYQNFTKKDFVSIVVQPKIQDSVKVVTPKYTAEELVLKRAEVSDDIKNQLIASLSDYGIDIVDVSIANLSFSKDYADAISQKSVLEQQIASARLNSEKVRIEGENNVLAAQKASEVRAIEAQQSAVNLEFFKLQVQDRAVAKWNGVSPLYVGASAAPLLTVPVQ